MPSDIVLECSKAIASRGWNISFAESASAGKMSSEFSLSPESGKILRGGIVCYEVFVKEQILHIPDHLIKEYTPESAEVTKAVTEQAAKLFHTKITVGITGLTTPGGSETKEKPMGTIFLHIITPVGDIAHREVFDGSAEEIVQQAINRTAELIKKKIH